VCCDECSLWYHKSCIEMCTPNYDRLQDSNVSWSCCKCHTANFHTSLFRSYMVDVVGENMFSVLAEHNTEDSIASADSSFNPHMFSSPKNTQPSSSSSSTIPHLRRSEQVSKSHSHSWSTKGSSTQSQCTTLPAKKQNWTTVVINCNCAPGKRAAIANVIDYMDPDCSILTETKIDNGEHTS